MREACIYLINIYKLSGGFFLATRRKNYRSEPDDNVSGVDFSENRTLLFFHARPHINCRYLYTKSRTRVYAHNEPGIEQITDGINPRNRGHRKREGLTNDFGRNCYTTPRVDGDETNGLVLGTNTIYYIIYTSIHKRLREFDGDDCTKVVKYALPVFRLDSLTIGVGRWCTSCSYSA